MTKPELGNKHLCPECGVKFYDMLKQPVICPGCQTKVAVSETISPRSKGEVAVAATAKKTAAAKPDADEDIDNVDDIIDEDIELEDEDDDFIDLEDDDEDDLEVIGVDEKKSSSIDDD